MAILMVISAIQFIGVTCLMNHVILSLASQNEGLTAVLNKEQHY